MGTVTYKDGISLAGTDGKLVVTTALNDASGNEVAATLNYTTNKDAGNDTGLLISMTDTKSEGTSLLIDAKVGANSVFTLSNGAALSIPSDSAHIKLGASSDTGLQRLAASYLEVTNGSTSRGGMVLNDLYISSSGTNNYAFAVLSGFNYAGLNNVSQLKWSSTDSAAAYGSVDTGLARSAAGVVKVTDGSTGTGSLVASSAITAVGTAAYNGVIRTGVYKRAWTNAEVVGLGASKDAELKVATLPAKTVVRNAYVVVDTRETALTDLTVALGRTGATYIDYIVASDAKAESLGSELVTNGTFTGNANGWTLGGGGGTPDWFYDTNKVSHASDGVDQPLEQETPLTLIVGRQYKLVFTITSYTSGSVFAIVGGTNGTSRSSAATFTEYFIAQDTFSFSFEPSVDFQGSIDDVSLKLVAQTVYGDASGERGTNLVGYDLPSYTATTDVYLNFVTTDAGKNLADALQSTGTVYLMTETLP